MRLLTSRLNDTARSAVRFTIVGLIGTLVQYALYDALLWLFDRWMGGVNNWLTNLAFVTAFFIEMTANYFFTTYYTFRSRPSWKNVSGFAGSRVVNFLIQMGLLNLLLLILRHWEDAIDTDRWAGLAAILIAGVVNYFLLRLIFRKKKEIQTQQKERAAAYPVKDISRTAQ